MKLELSQLFDYKTFYSNGRVVPDGYRRIPCHMIFDVKQSGKRKARFVAGGHMTNPPKDSVYSSVVSLRSIRLVTFLAELNGLELMAGDVGNAYLEAHTKEKVCFRAGPEFGELEGQIMVINKALYGLRSSGARFHEKFAATLQSFGFSPSFADPDVWIRDGGSVYEYVCTYVDDLLVAMKDPSPFMEALTKPPHDYKLKGVGPPSYHLGGDFFRDSDGCLCYGAQTYIRRMVENFQHLFGCMPTKVMSPLVKNDHPELDTSELCGPDDVMKFQSLIGALQWTISLCRFDVANAVMTLGRFRAEPRLGHLDRAKRIVGYLSRFPHGAIRFRTGIPNHEAVFASEPEKHS
ncbi:MAG: reverse transcriptase domain-containing protein, partial [Myxococcota bacterium]